MITFFKNPLKKFITKNVITKSFWKVLEMCYIQMLIYAEFKIINVFFKERRSK